MCSYDIAPMVKKYQKSKNEQNNKQNKIIEKNIFAKISISFCLIRKKNKKVGRYALMSTLWPSGNAYRYTCLCKYSV